MTDAFVRLEHLRRQFGSVVAVDDVSLVISRGEIVALLGPSGSGKTTVLRLLAGFERPDGGRVLVGGDDVTHLPAAARRFGMVFQHYALFPHLDVGQNVAFGLEAQGASGVPGRVAAALAMVDLAGLERRRVSELSGGQQQRVALARALAPEPRVLLLDEPLSNLDPALRTRTRRELADLIHRIGITTIFVTHEQDEAFDLGDRVALLERGRLVQVAPAEALYSAPATPFAAGFIGRSSAVPVEVVEGGPGRARVRLGTAEWDVPPPAHPVPPGPGVLYIRPDAVYLADAAPGTVGGTVGARRFGAGGWLYDVALDVGAQLEAEGAATLQPGQRVAVLPSRRGTGGLHLFARGTA